MAHSARLTNLELQAKLPSELAEEAQSKGLLSEDRLSSLLIAEIMRERTSNLLAFADRLAAAPGSTLSPEEVEEEIAGARARRR